MQYLQQIQSEKFRVMYFPFFHIQIGLKLAKQDEQAMISLQEIAEF